MPAARKMRELYLTRATAGQHKSSDARLGAEPSWRNRIDFEMNDHFASLAARRSYRGIIRFKCPGDVNFQIATCDQIGAPG
jgi:hypothetical protein